MHPTLLVPVTNCRKSAVSSLEKLRNTLQNCAISGSEAL